MWTQNLVIILFIQVAFTTNVTENSENLSISKNSNKVAKINENHNNKKYENETAITQSEIRQLSSVIPQNNTGIEDKKTENDETNKKPVLPTHQIKQQSLNADDFDFKYYWFLLAGSSFFIIGLIIFKSFRMQRSRAEIRYGKPKESDEIEPLGNNSKWEDDSSSENEDEIFDINFLKNTRLQKHSDNI